MTDVALSATCSEQSSEGRRPAPERAPARDPQRLGDDQPRWPSARTSAACSELRDGAHRRAVRGRDGHVHRLQFHQHRARPHPRRASSSASTRISAGPASRAVTGSRPACRTSIELRLGDAHQLDPALPRRRAARPRLHRRRQGSLRLLLRVAAAASCVVNGLIIFDNMLRGGKVVDPVGRTEPAHARRRRAQHQACRAIPRIQCGVHRRGRRPADLPQARARVLRPRALILPDFKESAGLPRGPYAPDSPRCASHEALLFHRAVARIVTFSN